MCVRAYVCVCVSVCVCVHACVYVCVCVHEKTIISTCYPFFSLSPPPLPPPLHPPPWVIYHQSAIHIESLDWNHVHLLHIRDSHERGRLVYGLPSPVTRRPVAPPPSYCFHKSVMRRAADWACSALLCPDPPSLPPSRHTRGKGRQDRQTDGRGTLVVVGLV